jgi:hypothetical protein
MQRQKQRHSARECSTTAVSFPTTHTTQGNVPDGHPFDLVAAGYQAGKADEQAPVVPSPLPVTDIECPMPLSLEKTFQSCHKKMKIGRKVFDEMTGIRVAQEKVLEMDIKPGLRKGSKIKFQGMGDQVEGGQQDVHLLPKMYVQIPSRDLTK